MAAQGFEQVYHLKGGILNYLSKTPVGQSRWRGDCFVFDDRVAVDGALRASGTVLCRKCSWPADSSELCERCKQAQPDDLLGPG